MSEGQILDFQSAMQAGLPVGLSKVSKERTSGWTSREIFPFLITNIIISMRENIQDFYSYYHAAPIMICSKNIYSELF